MENMRMRSGWVFGLAIITAIAIAATNADAFQEGWDSATVGTYRPDALPLPLIAADEGYWIIGDTVSEFPECGATPHTAEILSSDGSLRLRLTSNDSASSCADNIWVNLREVPPLGLNTGFAVPLNSETIISFEETGSLVDPESGSPYCVNPPCGDTVALSLVDNRGNMLAYVLQRAPDAVPNTVHSSYREIFLNPGAVVHSRNLFADFSTIPAFNPIGATIKVVAFDVDEHGTATIDDICIGGSECVVTPTLTVIPDVVGLIQSQAEEDIVAASLSVGTVTKEVSRTVPAGSVISQSPAAGTEVAVGTEVDLVVSKKILDAKERKIVPRDGAAYDYFGISVSISDDYAIVGASGDDDYGIHSGSAYIYARSGASWNQVAKLTASDASAVDQFGKGVSISGDYAIVGADGDDDHGDKSGSAYVFERSGASWIQVAKLTASDGAALDNFGWSVSISGDYAIVGAYDDDDHGDNSGSAYIFKRSGTGWNQVTKLTASDASTRAHFGRSVSISGDYAIVGASGDDDHGDNSGAAYIFIRSGTVWRQVAKLTASDGSATDEFGWSVSISGDRAIVGAFGNDDRGDNSGAAYIFENGGASWNQVAKLSARDGAYFDRFGISVSISGDYAIVGAYRADGSEYDAGAAYIFEKNGTSWHQVEKLSARDGAAFDHFGESVSISGDHAIVGAVKDDDNGESSGSAYIFNLFSSGKMAMPWIPLLLMED